MTRVILFGNFKGGVGKTTNSAMTALELARRGYKTLVIDLDPQGNITNLMLKTKMNFEPKGVEFPNTLLTALRNKNLAQARVPILDNLDILASAPDFSFYPILLEQLFSDYNERVRYLGTLLADIKNQYDYIVVDVPPTISLITDSALYLTDYCVIVLQTQERSLQGAENFLDYIQRVVINKYKAPTLDVLGILPVLLKNGAPVDIQTLKNATDEFKKENMFSTTIKSMERLKRYDVTGVTFDSQFDSKVQAVYQKVVDELIRRVKERG